MKTTTRKADLTRRIAELESTPRAMIASDSGTHGQPLIHHIYMEIDGSVYGTASFAGSNAARCSIESVHADTHGRVRQFPLAKKEMEERQRELLAARQELAALGG